MIRAWVLLRQQKEYGQCLLLAGKERTARCRAPRLRQKLCSGAFLRWQSSSSGTSMQRASLPSPRSTSSPAHSSRVSLTGRRSSRGSCLTVSRSAVSIELVMGQSDYRTSHSIPETKTTSWVLGRGLLLRGSRWCILCISSRW